MRGPGKHQKRLSAPSHWLLDKLSGSYAPKASPGPHKLRDCMPLIVFIRNRYEKENTLEDRERIAMGLRATRSREHKSENTKADGIFLAV
jgi:small subunit ribosomal protein S4e